MKDSRIHIIMVTYIGKGQTKKVIDAYVSESV